jgi:hypothetical protein
MIINNMTNVIKNLEHSKSIGDIIDDLNELILTLGGRNHPEQVEHVPEQDKAPTVTPVQTKTETNDKTVTVTKPRPATGSPHPRAPVVGPPSESEPKQTKATNLKVPGREKVECRCGLMVCNAAMSRHEKGAKHKEAMTKKEKTEMK